MDKRRWAATLRQLIADRCNIARLLPRAGSLLVTTLILAELVLGVLPVAFVVATAMVLGRVPAAVDGGLTSPAWGSLVSVFVVAAAIFVAIQVVAPLERSLGELVTRRIDGHVFDELISASLRSPGLGPLENQRALDDLQAAAREVEFGLQSPGRAASGLLALIARYTQLAGYAVAIGVVFSWLASAGLVVAVLLFRYGQRGGLRKYVEVRYRVAARERKVDYLRELAIDGATGKEIRVFGLVGWLRDSVREAYLAFLRPLWTERRRIYLAPFIWFSSWALAVTALVFGMIGATAGTLALTGFALVVQAAIGSLRLAEYYPEADLQTAIGMSAYGAVQRFSAHVDAAGGPSHTGPRPAVPEPADVIRFDHVGFGYTGRPEQVFDELDLTIPVGRCTAIVGVNGAGKTTLVKLLARLYEPTSGRITLDGIDIRTYPVDEWRAKLSVIFQDFVRYESSVADNVGLGAVDFLGDRASIRAAVEAVGLADALERLPRGLDTPLSRHLTDGMELSGGQWQRIALARALFALRHGSPIVVLDEPTASLDVRAEAQFFEQFAGLTRGATTLLISHRFSTVRHADVIVVLEHGQVVERGGHDDLVARNGRYAELFRLQANRFVGADPTAPPSGIEEVA